MSEVWIAAVAVGAGTMISAYGKRQAANKQAKAMQGENEINFQRQAWLRQQERLFDLEDRREAQEMVRPFGEYAPESAKTFNGKEVTRPELVNPGSGLMDYNPNETGALDTYFTRVAAKYGDEEAQKRLDEAESAQAAAAAAGGGGGGKKSAFEKAKDRHEKVTKIVDPGLGFLMDLF